MRHFHFKALADIERCASQVGATHVEFEPDPERIKATLARRVRLGDFTLGNSIAIHPMEGCDGTLDGRPDDLTWRRYRRFASGGAKLIWFEATAVRAEGRANPRQLWLRPQNMPEFARLLETMRREHAQCCGSADDCLEVLQLTHSGRYSAPRRVIACHNPVLDRKTGVPPDYPVISDDDLERLEDDYAEAARLAVDAGFRAIDIKAVHGYLLNEILSARTREGRYGGPLENRARFFRNVIGKIRAAVGSRLLLAVRLGCFDGFPGGWGEDLTEVTQLVGWLKQWGVALLSVSMGSPYINPHIVRPFEKPDEGNYEQPEHPLLGVDRHFRVAGELQRAFPDLPMAGAGYSWLQRFMIHAAARNIENGSIRIFGAGRCAIAYPDFAQDALEKGELDERRVCKTLSFCVYLMRRKKHPLGQFPTGCVPFDKRIYGPIMKQARETERET
jgi:2,4-dienoyl-CoA reductase-like NADH-dependent reductase (Old Yellow Enzyme family)